MKKAIFKVLVLLVILIVALASVYYLKFSGVTHDDLYEVIVEESMITQQTVDDRYRKLDQKLDRIESKLDRILELAKPPLPDGL